jgi:hypothetical protein
LKALGPDAIRKRSGDDAEHRQAGERHQSTRRAHDGAQQVEKIGDAGPQDAGDEKDAGDEQGPAREHGGETHVRRLHDFEPDRAGAVSLFAEPRFFVVGKQRRVLRLVDVVVAIERREFRFDLGSGIEALAQFGGLVAMLGDFAGQ